MPGEKRGLIPNAQFYDKAYRGHWNGLTVISISIGQGEILSTPLQIANLGATIANRGYFVTPHIVKEIQDNQLDSIYRVPRYTTIEKRHYESVVEGMRGAATGGTCRMLSVMVPDLEACGKTGTAQNRGHDHSVFMGFGADEQTEDSYCRLCRERRMGGYLRSSFRRTDDGTVFERQALAGERVEGGRI